jgi:hypothetical protein
VSEFAVRNSDAESISSGKIRTSLSSTPTLWNPRRTATNDAPWMLFRYASTPRTKSRWSYSRCAVSGVGAPSLNSSVPSLLCTVSGVVIEAGTFVVVLIAPSPVRAARTVRAAPEQRKPPSIRSGHPRGMKNAAHPHAILRP